MELFEILKVHLPHCDRYVCMDMQVLRESLHAVDKTNGTRPTTEAAPELLGQTF